MELLRTKTVLNLCRLYTVYIFSHKKQQIIIVAQNQLIGI
ncbi:hypothetical protein P20311_0080 [Pseudoalteromonas sp. BSi20311]|nr:hypothetical protein P20311_0080 [Pseudoalteromonas sp. BSi20311]GAA73474.1 hypothetical protein P20439_3594 [Pseudoalteromonas sp. BSi20439]